MTELIIAFTLGFYLGPACLHAAAVIQTERDAGELSAGEIAITALIAGLSWPLAEVRAEPRE